MRRSFLRPWRARAGMAVLLVIVVAAFASTAIRSTVASTSAGHTSRRDMRHARTSTA
jgi:hypothetical protein